MKILPKAKRYRFTQDTFDALSKVRSYGKSEARFVREAIIEKLCRDTAQIIEEQKRKKIIDCPF